MIDTVESYTDESWSNMGQGYGFWCGKGCAAKKIAACIPYKRNNKRKGIIAGTLPPSCRQPDPPPSGGGGGGGGSNTGLIVGVGLVGLLVVGGIIFAVTRK